MSQPLPRNLHFGCLDRVVEGWLNTDVTPHLWIARVPGAAALLHAAGGLGAERYAQHRQGLFARVRYLDLRRRFPFSDASFDNAFSAHVIEHLYRRDAKACLAEVRRVLCPGGLLRIGVPDLDRVVRSYDPRQPERLLKAIYETDQERDKNRHHWMYNEVSLASLLAETGFGDIRRCAFREGDCPDLDQLDNRPDETLFMEARR